MPESEGHGGVIVICDHILYLVKKFGAFWSIFKKTLVSHNLSLYVQYQFSVLKILVRRIFYWL